MKRLLVCLLLFLPSLSWAQFFAANPIAAKQVWESVIAAKGGRERLHAVRTFGVKLKRGPWYAPGYQLRAYRFPSKIWFRNGPIETLVEAYDSEHVVGAYVGRHYRELHAPKKGQVEEGGKTSDHVMVTRVVDGQVCYAIRNFLLETSWYRPEIAGVREVKWKGKDAFVLYLNDCAGASAYIIDAKTRLPRERISFFNIHERWKTELPEVLTPVCPYKINYLYHYFSTARVKDYISVDGLMLPQHIDEEKMTYEINRDYPDSLFTTPPTLADWGP